MPIKGGKNLPHPARYRQPTPPNISYLGGSRNFDERTGQYRPDPSIPTPSRMNELQRKPAGPAAPLPQGRIPLNPNPAPMRTPEGNRVGRPVSRGQLARQRFGTTRTPTAPAAPAGPSWDVRLGQNIGNAYRNVRYGGTPYETVDQSVRGGMWDRMMELMQALLGGG